MSKSDATQASKSFNYQEDVNANLDRVHDLSTSAHDEEIGDEDTTMEAANYVKAAVQKVVYSLTSVIYFLLYICHLAAKNCSFCPLNSSASRELGQTDPDFKCTKWRISTKPHPHS